VRRDVKVAAEPRSTRGKNEARRLRARKLIPAILYGAYQDPVAIAISPKDINKILRSSSGHNTIFDVQLDGQSTPAMVVDWQLEPVRDTLLHVDLKRIDLTKRIRVSVPVMTQGEPQGVKIQGGLLEVITREVEVECLPDEIPESFVVDVAELMMGQSKRASDLPMEGSMKLLSPADSVLAHIVALRAEEEAAAAEAPAEGEAATPAGGEPEVIKKGKKEEEAAAEADKKKK
jgi:large subunit ribosomal protein L25